MTISAGGPGAVLVTGGAGYIGSHAVLALLEAGRRVVVLDDLSTGRLGAVPDDVEFHHGAVDDEALLDEILGDGRITAVLHFAGSISVADSVADPGRYYHNNTGALVALADGCRRHGVGAFIFSSSAAVYGRPEVNPVSEDAPTRPVSPYGASKLMAERILRDLSAAHPDFRPVCLRYFNVAGADPMARAGPQARDAADLVKMAVETALGRRDHLDIFGQRYLTRDGTCERDFIHVSDLAAAHVSALRYLEAGGPAVVLNCGYGHGYTVLEVVGALERLLGRTLDKRLAPPRTGDVDCCVSDPSRLRRTLDWRPKHDELATILKTALAWYAAAPPPPVPA
jgi:UDP-glucose 4-epimerase